MRPKTTARPVKNAKVKIAEDTNLNKSTNLKPR